MEVKERWHFAFCSCNEQGCWCPLLVKVRAIIGTDIPPCPNCMAGEHFTDPPWYYKELLDDQRYFIKTVGFFSE